MSRKFKVIGLALVAVLAMSAVVSASASAATFTSAEAGAELQGSQSNLHEFGVGGGTVSCEVAEFTGTAAATSSATQTITPFYGAVPGESCEAFGLPAHVNVNNCDYLFSAAGTVDLQCPTGNEITITDAFGFCVVHVKPQTGINGISYANNGNHVDVTAAANNIHAVVTGALCPITAGTYNNATYNGKVTLKGDNGATKISWDA